jgi:hypothetical protein
MRKIALPIIIVVGMALHARAFASKRLVVDLSKSTVYAFEDDHLVKALVVNPGDSDHLTRPGEYKITQKQEKGYRSNLVDIHNKPLKPGGLGAPMDYWMRLGGTGMGFHRSSLWRPNGRWGSHGCLRMSRAGANWLYHWTPMRTPVTVVANGVDLASAVAPKYLKKSAAKADQKLASRLTGPKADATPSKSGDSAKTDDAPVYYGEPTLAPIKTVSREEVQAPHLTR